MYVGYYQDNRNNKLLVSERINGHRVLEEFPLILEYYVPDSDGYYMGYDGKRVRKIQCSNIYEFNSHKKDCQSQGLKTYELNFNIPNKVLYQHFKQSEIPTLHLSFMDIEVDRKGYERLTVKELVDKACCPINAISIYNGWQDTMFTLMLRPENLSYEEAFNICQKFDNTYLFEDEKDLLNGIINVLSDTDCASGWNSSFFDTPYIVRRIENVLGKGESKRLCLWNIDPVYKEKKNKFGDVNIYYDIVGKWFVDYMELYQKHERGKKESYKLDSIAEIELGERKVQHDESLDDMYRQRYEDFIKYNRQDTMLVKKLEDKLKYIEIHNAQAHDIRCSLESTMGTVGWVEQAIINEAHSMGLIVNDRDERKNSGWEGIIPPGAYCADPIIKGLVNDIFSFDMSSLYPSCIRSINISPETMVAQVQLNITLPRLWKKIEEEKLWKNVKERKPDWGAAWGGLWAVDEYWEIKNQTNTVLTLQFVEGGEIQKTAKEIHDIIFADNSNLNISAFGTIYRTDKKGLIPSILGKWFGQRKEYKKEMFKYEAMATGVQIEDEKLLKLLESE